MVRRKATRRTLFACLLHSANTGQFTHTHTHTVTENIYIHSLHAYTYKNTATHTSRMGTKYTSQHLRLSSHHHSSPATHHRPFLLIITHHHSSPLITTQCITPGRLSAPVAVITAARLSIGYCPLRANVTATLAAIVLLTTPVGGWLGAVVPILITQFPGLL